MQPKIRERMDSEMRDTCARPEPTAIHFRREVPDRRTFSLSADAMFLSIICEKYLAFSASALRGDAVLGRDYSCFRWSAGILRRTQPDAACEGNSFSCSRLRFGLV